MIPKLSKKERSVGGVDYAVSNGPIARGIESTQQSMENCCPVLVAVEREASHERTN